MFLRRTLHHVVSYSSQLVIQPISYLLEVRRIFSGGDEPQMLGGWVGG
jgi:hypothetical protein